MHTLLTLDEIQKRSIESLRRYLADGSTEDLRDVAGHFISAREHFYNKDGEPDWLGRTYAYRTWVREVMSLAGVPSADVTNTQAAIRYHAGNILRERLDDETLAALGLRSASPRERSIEKRAGHSATLSVFGSGGAELRTVDEMLFALRTMDATLARITPRAFRALTPKERRAVKEALVAVCKRSEEVSSAG